MWVIWTWDLEMRGGFCSCLCSFLGPSGQADWGNKQIYLFSMRVSGKPRRVSFSSALVRTLLITTLRNKRSATCFDACEGIPKRGSGLCLHVQSSMTNIRQELSEMDTKGRFQKAYGILHNLLHLDGENIFNRIYWSQGAEFWLTCTVSMSLKTVVCLWISWGFSLDIFQVITGC